jgi:RimJ/RimL family protein N-acetyltransferase
VTVSLRPAVVEDIELFFRLQQDQEAVWMAAFTSVELDDRVAFERRWRRILTEPDVTVFTVLDACDHHVPQALGQVLSFLVDGQPEVSYWIDRAHWGRGVATDALRLLLARVETRPLFARAAQDNAGSLAVLRHNGFTVVGEDVGPAAARGEMVKEYILRLDASLPPEPSSAP